MVREGGPLVVKVKNIFRNFFKIFFVIGVKKWLEVLSCKHLSC